MKATFVAMTELVTTEITHTDCIGMEKQVFLVSIFLYYITSVPIAYIIKFYFCGKLNFQIWKLVFIIDTSISYQFQPIDFQFYSLYN